MPCKPPFGIGDILCILVIVLACPAICAADGQSREFSEFSLVMPAGWDGEEQKGFVSDNPDEYLLTLGKKDEKEDHFEAQVSIFLLPNRQGASARDAATTLADAQGESSEPVLENGLYVFSGEPRSNVVKGIAKTFVNTTPEKMLIIIAQDPKQLGSAQILESLRGLTDSSRQLLGR